MKGLRLISLFFLLTAAGSLRALQPEGFQFFSEIRGPFPANEGVRLHLGQEILSKVKPDFSDLRLLDDRGQETPYVVYEQFQPPEAPLSFEFKIRSYNTQGPWEEIVLEKPKGVEDYHEVEVVTGASDFKKQVVVQTSADGKKFEEILSDTIFDFSSKVDLRKTNLELPLTSAPYLRLRLKDQTPVPEEKGVALDYKSLHLKVGEGGKNSFRVDSVRGVAGKEAPEETFWDHARFENPLIVTGIYGDTTIVLGTVNLPAAKVSLEIENPYYYRRVQLNQSKTGPFITVGTIYRISGMKESQNSFSVPGAYGDYFSLTIINEDNPPLKIKSVQLDWVRRNLYFIPEAGRNYTLYFGAEGMKAPSYELANILPDDSNTLMQYPEVLTASVQKNTQYRPGIPPTKKEEREKWIFSAVVFGLVILLGAWGYSLMRKLPKKS